MAGDGEDDKLQTAGVDKKKKGARFPDQEVTEVHHRSDSLDSERAKSPAPATPTNNRLAATFKSINEQTPLIGKPDGNDDDFRKRFTPPVLSAADLPGAEEEEEYETKSTWYIFLLTIGIGGYEDICLYAS